MQGGAALGAYEIGVYRVLYDWISMHIKEEENIFDIIAGTSSGAINSAILLNYVLERRRKDPTITIKQSWEGSADKLERFWQETSTQTIAEGPEFEPWWTWLKYTNGWLNWISPLRGSLSNSDASLEAARRHYSVKQIKETGARNFFSLSSVDPDTKFFDETPDNPSLSDKTLALLIQLPPSLKLLEGLESLRELVRELDTRFRYAIEVRDRSWFQDLAYNFFADNGICLAWSQLAEMKTPPIVTTDFIYLRLIGDRSFRKRILGECRSIEYLRCKSGLKVLKILMMNASGLQ